MTDATGVPFEVLSDVLSDPAAVLFGLEAEFGVLNVERTGPASVKLIIEQTARDGPCPACGVLSSTVKDLVVGSGLEFADRGEHELKGVPGTWRVFEAD